MGLHILHYPLLPIAIASLDDAVTANFGRDTELVIHAMLLLLLQMAMDYPLLATKSRRHCKAIAMVNPLTQGRHFFKGNAVPVRLAVFQFMVE
jgi:hypothetical protein